MEAEFISPFVDHLPGLLPRESEKAKFQVLLPKIWRSPSLKPTCLHLAGTGDHVCIGFYLLILTKGVFEYHNLLTLSRMQWDVPGFIIYIISIELLNVSSSLLIIFSGVLAAEDADGQAATR